MRQAFSKFELRALSGMIAAVILLGGLSFGTGLAVVSGPSHPELTVDICQPLQSSCIATSILLARPAPALGLDLGLDDLGSIVVKALTRSSADAARPDTPPPKLIA
jgi:hypothetical protein